MAARVAACLRRTGAQEEEPDDTNDPTETTQRSLLMHLVKQLTKGQDLTRVLIPTFFLAPRSLIEYYTDFFSHSNIMLGISKVDDPEKRFLQVLRWYISAWHNCPIQTVKKPYNPLLGEKFFRLWRHEDGTYSHYISEQVSHHPPVSGFYFENRMHNICLNASVWTKSKFFGNSAGSIPVGEGWFNITNLNEQYVMTFPTMTACNLFIGTLHTELGGECELRCEATGLIAEIEFKMKKLFRGELNGIKGTIRKINAPKTALYNFQGKWDSQVTIKDLRTKNTAVLFDVPQAKKDRSFVARLEDQGEWESRRLWQHLTKAVKDQNFDLAEQKKAENEEAQRVRAKQREEGKLPAHEPEFFKANEQGLWIFKNRNLTPYKEGEQSFLPVELVNLKRRVEEGEAQGKGKDAGKDDEKSPVAEKKIDDS